MYTHIIRTFGTNAYILDCVISDHYTKVGNDVGLATITIPANHAAVTGMELDDQVEIYRADRHPASRAPAVRDFRGLYRGYTLRTLDSGLDVADLFLFHENEILRRSINAYAAGQFLVTTWPGSTVTMAMLTTAANNFNSATIDLTATYTRLTPASSILVGLDSGGYTGPTIGVYTNAYQNVLTSLQELAALDNAVFVMTKASPPAATWILRIRGITFATDRRATVIFDVDQENMALAALDLRLIGETNVAFVGGQGEGASRVVRVRTSANRNIANNNYESFVDGRQFADNAALDAYGDSAINAKRARPLLNFEPVQLPSFNYGRHYFWGDVVTVRHGGQTFVQRIKQVSVEYNAVTGERIELGFEELP